MSKQAKILKLDPRTEDIAVTRLMQKWAERDKAKAEIEVPTWIEEANKKAAAQTVAQ